LKELPVVVGSVCKSNLVDSDNDRLEEGLKATISNKIRQMVPCGDLGRMVWIIPGSIRSGILLLIVLFEQHEKEARKKRLLTMKI
jgi:hypothetical protein